MEGRLIGLKLFLDALGVPFKIDKVEARKTIQKAVYLGQETGADMGYRFNWYRMGPYSPALTRDYFKLDEAIKAGVPVGDRRLHPALVDRLGSLAEVFKKPRGFSRSQADWLELLASLHFLRAVQHRTSEQARAVIHQEKAHLEPALPLAEHALASAGLLQPSH
jgi:hypothetical protein